MTRVRFAPTPTGNLFVSGVRVALANHLFARQTGGEMLLRLDDLDNERSRPIHADQIMQDLHWFGIDWLCPLKSTVSRRAVDSPHRSP